MEPRKQNALRCAIYTRKSSEEGLEQEFNSLQAQREACEAFIRSQQGEGWQLRKARYDDGGLSGATMERPALKRLLADIGEGLIDVMFEYKVDRLTRSLSDFARMVEIFDHHQVSFVAVTQQFNTTTSMGRLTLNVLLSFAQFEREVTGERIADAVKGSKFERSQPFRAAAEAGNVKLLRGAWNDGFLSECEQFSPDEREYAHDDQVDAACGALNLITKPQPFEYISIPRRGLFASNDDWDDDSRPRIMGGRWKNIRGTW